MLAAAFGATCLAVLHETSAKKKKAFGAGLAQHLAQGSRSIWRHIWRSFGAAFGARIAQHLAQVWRSFWRRFGGGRDHDICSARRVLMAVVSTSGVFILLVCAVWRIWLRKRQFVVTHFLALHMVPIFF